MRRVVVIVLMAGFAATAVMLGSASGGSTRRDQCSWHEGFGETGNGADGWVESLAVFDDGGGPALYIGGNFTSLGGVESSRFAVWGCGGSRILADGFEWASAAAWSASEP